MEHNITYESNGTISVTIININLHFLLKSDYSTNGSTLVNIIIIPRNIVNKLIEILSDRCNFTNTAKPRQDCLGMLNIKVDVIDYMDFLIMVDEDISVNSACVTQKSSTSNYYLKTSNYNARYFQNSIIRGNFNCGIQFTGITINEVTEENNTKVIVAWKNNKPININSGKIDNIEQIPASKLHVRRKVT